MDTHISGLCKAAFNHEHGKSKTEGKFERKSALSQGVGSAARGSLSLIKIAGQRFLLSKRRSLKGGKAQGGEMRGKRLLPASRSVQNALFSLPSIALNKCKARV